MRRVVKIGGSLLKSPDICSRLSDWHKQQELAYSLAIVGGGDLVNAIRDIDSVINRDQVSKVGKATSLDVEARLEEAEVHWLCVNLLTHTFNIMRRRLNWPAIETREQLEQWIERPSAFGTTTLVRVDTFYRQSLPSEVKEGDRSMPDAPASDLPENWDTTTDSIAARLAKLVHAQELIILKSCSVPDGLTLTQLSDAGVIDRAFPLAAIGIDRVKVERL
jgi:aspartokinase-like uncharacterized kinase